MAVTKLLFFVSALVYEMKKGWFPKKIWVGCDV